MQGATTNASQELADSGVNSMSKTLGADGEGFQLPNINHAGRQSPFKGFLDISIVT